ncbi:nucleoside triphosphate pyrophosphohydrolase [Salsuginibacillus kocurii]|uniref:nucleoside triphosphate pyrophosphohydrolase n=1 Tax=Salsuginibacillus kocurii TaxID=427078 RepID=UPI00037133A9|nr:nucleoside triphosphate pyrophosphohydrolase [Salsuginibacillus kocurii]
MPIYNKLVRDKIPEVIGASGKDYELQVLDRMSYMKEAQKKLLEEAEEYREASKESNEVAIEELADLLELIYALAEEHGATPAELEHVRKEKEEQRGGFSERLYLVSVEDDE